MAVQTTRQLPAQFVEDLGKDLAQQVVAQTGVPVVTTGIAGISQQPGESAADFQARQQAAQQITTRQQSLSGIAPTVAGQDALQTQAQNLATQGVGSFAPFLQQAQTAGTAAQTALGGVTTGAPAFQQEVSDFMSPYQSQVIDASLAEFDRNRAIQEQSIRDQQAALGALGSGRAGVQLAEFGTGAARERALLEAQLRQQGFGQAMAARQQDIANRGALASQQQGLGGFQAQLGAQQQALQGTDISRLGQLGALNQAQAQAQADATREAARQAAFLPQEQLDRYAGQVTGIMGGYPAQFQTTNIPNPTPLQTALGVGTTLAGVYGAFSRPDQQFGGVFGSLNKAEGGRIGYAGGGGSEDPMLEEMYEKYVAEMTELGIEPMPFRQFKEQAMADK